MILDLSRFVQNERPHWEELEAALKRMHAGSLDLSDLAEARRVLALFQRACSDLSRLGESQSEPELRQYLETLVARGYAEIHSTRSNPARFRPVHWLVRSFPQAFRRHIWGFHLSSAITLVGMLVGCLLVALDPDAMAAISPFPHTVEMRPSERVAKEEKAFESGRDRLQGHKSTFSAELMQNNIGVAIKAMAFGLTWGIGTVIMLFYNGAILGAVALDYIMDGQTIFMLAWLLPHGSWEIPAILIAGQAGLLLARALIGWGTREGLRTRMRAIVGDLATLIGGVAIMLVWAGFVEAFLSQYHAPVVPYWIKIAVGVAELAVLFAWLMLAGRKPSDAEGRAV